MNTFTQEQLLLERIEHLQLKQDIELRQLKKLVHGSIENLNPLASYMNGNASQETKSNLVNAAVNITSQFLSRNTVFGLFQKPIKNILGNLLQHFIK